MSILTSFQSAHSVIMEKRRKYVKLTKITETLDSEGRVTSKTETTDTEVGIVLQPITEKDRDLLGRGVTITGYMKAWANATYDLTNNGDDTTIEVGDIITHNNKKYVVESIEGKETISGTEVHRKLLLRCQDT